VDRLHQESIVLNVVQGFKIQLLQALLPPISAHLTRLTKIQPGDSVLDVACGNGNTAITAHRQGANVVGIDITPELLSLAIEEEEKTAQVKGIVWKEADAQHLPFEDDSLLSFFRPLYICLHLHLRL
jgi:ubiquinone/menaquinone biosynthesis C-methylase UbiE